MPVLIEAISVIVDRKAISNYFSGGESVFEALIPNATACRDEFLVRVGFMHPDDVGAFLDQLSVGGLYIHNGEAFIHAAVVDQNFGPTSRVDWLEIKQDQNGVKYANHISDTSEARYNPVGWDIKRSLYRSGSYIDMQDMDDLLSEVSETDGTITYFDNRLEKTMHTARTAQRSIEELNIPLDPISAPTLEESRNALLALIRDLGISFNELSHRIRQGSLSKYTLKDAERWGLYRAGLTDQP